jgi:flagellar hook-length control protein FliK
MRSVNNLTDTQAKAGIVQNLLASLHNSSSHGDLFQELLSGTQTPAVDPHQSHTPSATDQQNQSNSANNANTPDVTTGNTPHQTVHGDNGSKSVRHVRKNDQDNSPKAQQTNAPASNSAAANNDQTDANTKAAVNPNNSPSSTVQTDNDTNTADNNDTVSAANNSTTDQTTDDNAALNANVIAAINANPAPTDPVPPPAPVPSSAGDATTTDQSKTDTPSSDLLQLLMQLERMAGAQLANATPANTPAANNTGAQAPGTQNTPAGNGSDPFNKIDLRSLMAAIAGLDGNNSNAGTQTNDPASSDANQTQSSAALMAAMQGAASTSASTKSTTNADKLINQDFLNLFNVTQNDPNNTSLPFGFGPAANAGLNFSNGDSTGLDVDLHGQNSSNLRDTATLTNNTNTQLAAPAQASSPYDFASQLSAVRASKGGNTGLPTPVEQVVMQLRNGLNKDGSSEMTIQLRPAELGRIDVKLHVDSEGKVQGTVTADNSTTLGLLLKDVRGLERALQEAGLRADSGSLQFNLRGDGQAGGNAYQANNNNQKNFGNGDDDLVGTQIAAFADAETYYLTPGGVNLRV